ncbi:HAD-like domain [Plasmopara halstedii]|uniref:HAD-like domain n=1 Tax=Plasmopara halstedii TaxID=4781 RepID=A0A0P1ACN5_PLAHL|nr:HAD-like domain [Plasmopara halstedii]CEG38698.1 HAD-like domain [Plasmopara halstedii]|eukprot:XP_024575067.1 HAD-like domain [Plasmopara halstedii]
MQMPKVSKARPILLCTDFDETITQHDTTSLLFELATSTSVSIRQQLMTQYANETDEFVRHYKIMWQRQNQNQKNDFVSEFDDAGLREFLEGYAAVDLRSMQRVVEDRALKGIRLDDLIKASTEVRIRPDCIETLASIDKWIVISVNWSRKLVETVMDESGVTFDTTQIIANELEMNAESVTTGIINVKVQSSMDKERFVNHARMMQKDTQSILVYVGDSVTDLLALIAADLGIWMVSDASTSSTKLLDQLVKFYRIHVHPLIKFNSFRECIAKASDDRPVLFTVSSWAQLKSFIESASKADVTKTGN